MRAWTLDWSLGGCAASADAGEENQNGHEEGYHDSGTYACAYTGFSCG
jgi:hypothetical protein